MNDNDVTPTVDGHRLLERASSAFRVQQDRLSSEEGQRIAADRAEAEAVMAQRYGIGPEVIAWGDGRHGVVEGFRFRCHTSYGGVGSGATRYFRIEWLRKDGNEWLGAADLADLGRLIETGAICAE